MNNLYSMAEFSHVKKEYSDFHYPDLPDGEYTGRCVAGHWSQHAILHLMVQLSDGSDKLDLCFFRDSYNRYCFSDWPESFIGRNIRFSLKMSGSGKIYCRNIEVI